MKGAYKVYILDEGPHAEHGARNAFSRP